MINTSKSMPRTSRLSDEEIARLPPPGLAIPSDFQFSPDGTHLAFLWSEDSSRKSSLWVTRIADGVTTCTISADTGFQSDTQMSKEALMERERKRQLRSGVWSFAWSGRGATLIVPAPGKLIAHDVHTGVQRVLLESATFSNARLSPDGTRVAFTDQRELWCTEIGDADGPLPAPRKLTTSASETAFSGIPEFVAQEELGRKRQHVRDGATSRQHDERAVLDRLARTQPSIQRDRRPEGRAVDAIGVVDLIGLAIANRLVDGRDRTRELVAVDTGLQVQHTDRIVGSGRAVLGQPCIGLVARQALQGSEHQHPQHRLAARPDARLQQLRAPLVVGEKQGVQATAQISIDLRPHGIELCGVDAAALVRETFVQAAARPRGCRGAVVEECNAVHGQIERASGIGGQHRCGPRPAAVRTELVEVTWCTHAASTSSARTGVVGVVAEFEWS